MSRRSSRFRAPAAAGLLLLCVACSGESGPLGRGGDATISGVLTGDGAAGQAQLAGEGSVGTGAPLRGVSIRLIDDSGTVLFDSATDERGEFELRAPAGTYRLEVGLADGDVFTIEVTVDEGENLFFQGNVRRGAARFVIDAELFTDDDADGVSDSGFTIRIVGRESGRPGSGEEIVDRDPDDDLDDEEDDLDDGRRASLDDFELGQRVLVKGDDGDGFFDADEVHGNSGRGNDECRLSGVATAVERSTEGSLEALEIFGIRVDVSGARVAGVRGSGGPGSSLDVGTRVEIHATFDAANGELVARLLHARNGSGRDPARISGFLTAEPDVTARRLEVCGIEVRVSENARITNGRGGDESEEDGDDDEDDDDGDDEDGDDGEDEGAATFAAFLRALGAEGPNDDVRGRFTSDGVIVAEKVAAGDGGRDLEIIGAVQAVDQTAGTFQVLGVTVAVDAATEFKGNMDGVSDLSSGARVRVELRAGGGTLTAVEIQRAGGRDDRVRGGTLALLSSALEASPNFEVRLPGGGRIPVDAGARTEFEVED